MKFLLYKVNIHNFLKELLFLIVFEKHFDRKQIIRFCCEIVKHLTWNSNSISAKQPIITMLRKIIQ